MTDDQLYSLARHLSGRYRLPGMTRQDVAQEAYVLLRGLVPTYDPSRHSCTLRRFLERRGSRELYRMAVDAGRDANVCGPMTDATDAEPLGWDEAFDLADDGPTPDVEAGSNEAFRLLADRLTRREYVVACVLAECESDITHAELAWFRSLDDDGIQSFRKKLSKKVGMLVRKMQ